MSTIVNILMLFGLMWGSFTLVGLAMFLANLWWFRIQDKKWRYRSRAWREFFDEDGRPVMFDKDGNTIERP
jgi:hypothetical protein